MTTYAKFEELRKARNYLKRCEEALNGAMHCDDEAFRQARANVRRAEMRVAQLEKELSP